MFSSTKEQGCGNSTREGGTYYLLYLSAGDVAFFRVLFAPIFPRMEHQKKAILLEQTVKTCRERKILLDWVIN